MNLDRARGTRLGDRHSDSLVLGKTKTELRNQFAYRLAPACLRSCFRDSSWRNRDVIR